MSGSARRSEFLALAEEVVQELRRAVARHGPHSREYPNAALALANVERWHERVARGTRRPTGAGTGLLNSGLEFGPVEARLRRLEHLWLGGWGET